MDGFDRFKNLTVRTDSSSKRSPESGTEQARNRTPRSVESNSRPGSAKGSSSSWDTLSSRSYGRDYTPGPSEPGYNPTRHFSPLAPMPRETPVKLSRHPAGRLRSPLNDDESAPGRSPNSNSPLSSISSSSSRGSGSDAAHSSGISSHLSQPGSRGLRAGRYPPNRKRECTGTDQKWAGCKRHVHQQCGDDTCPCILGCFNPDCEHCYGDNSPLQGGYSSQTVAATGRSGPPGSVASSRRGSSGRGRRGPVTRTPSRRRSGDTPKSQASDSGISAASGMSWGSSMNMSTGTEPSAILYPEQPGRGGLTAPTPMRGTALPGGHHHVHAARERVPMTIKSAISEGQDGEGSGSGRSAFTATRSRSSPVPGEIDSLAQAPARQSLDVRKSSSNLGPAGSGDLARPSLMSVSQQSRSGPNPALSSRSIGSRAAARGGEEVGAVPRLESSTSQAEADERLRERKKGCCRIC